MRLLVETGVSDRVLRDGYRHEGIELGFGGEGHRIDFADLVGAAVQLYPQTDVFIDLADARERDGGDVRFGVSDVAVVDVTSDRPGILFTDADGRRAGGPLRLPRRRRRVAQHLPPRASRRPSAASSPGSTRSPGSASSARHRRARPS